MGESIVLRARGLYTHPNDLSAVPKGSMLVADNAVIDREDVCQSRRGFKKYGTDLGSDPIDQLFSYQSRILVSYDDKLAYDSDGAGTWVNYSGAVIPPLAGARLRSVQSNENFYVTSSTGVRKLDAYNGTLTDAGVPPALDGNGSTTGASGFLANNYQVAYRMVWGYKDANDNLILGAPSQRVVVENTSGGTRDVSLTFTIPSGITTSYFYQIYRSGQFASGIEPDDELQLVYEDNPTAGEIAAKAFTITDSTPDSLRGATLYTSPSQEGIANSNTPPPLCTDMTLYRQYVFFGNTSQKQGSFLTYVGGLALADTVTIAGTTYTAAAAENIAAGEFELFTGGTPATDIQDTALSLVRVINRYATNTAVYAYYISGYADLPGKMYIEARAFGASSFAMTASSSAAGQSFDPTLPTSGTSVSSSDNPLPNAIYYSKASQPESVPLGNYLLVGTKEEPVRRIVALRESLFILKDDGIFRLTGTDPTSFEVSLLDNTAVIQGIDSACAFNNQVWCMSNQGALAISDTGVAVMSRPIEKDLIQVTAPQYTNFSTATFGFAYESDRKYILATVTDENDTYATQEYVYNSFTNSWTRWTRTFNCGFVNPADNKIYWGHPTNGYVYVERKNFTTSDYADESLAVTIASSTGTTVVLASTTGVNAGDSLEQGVLQSYIVSVDSGTDITVEDTFAWAAGAATVNTPIDVALQWVPQTADNAGLLKQFREVTVMYSTSNFNEMEIGFNSNFSEDYETFTLTPVQGNGFGTLPFGTGNFGASVSQPQGIRTYVPLLKQRALWITPTLESNRCFAGFALNGITIQWEPMSSRFY